MKNLIKGLLLTLLITAATTALADVPAEVAGVYGGKVTLTSYDGPKPVKTKLTGMLQVTEDGSTLLSLRFPGEQSDDQVTGECLFYQGNLYFKSTGEFEPISGRLGVKGKTGKQSLKGTVHMITGGYVGLIELKMKLKRITLINE